MPSLKQLTDEQLTTARDLYEAGELALSEVCARSGIHYLRLLSLADKHSWIRKSSRPEIMRARRIAGMGLQRRALQYLCSLVPTPSPELDEEIIAETRRMHLILSRRADDSARSAAQGSWFSRSETRGRGG